MDSRELFELLADGHVDQIQELDGYGVITWVEAGSQNVKLAKLSEGAEIVVAEMTTGGLVWASTWEIIYKAITAAGLRAERVFNLDEVGRVYRLGLDGCFVTHETGIKLSERPTFDSWYRSAMLDDEDYWDWKDWDERTQRDSNRDVAKMIQGYRVIAG